jgi:fucose 4-O-acetylase-like acetyltransferase
MQQTLPNQPASRILWVDAAKVFAIWLVVLGHLQALPKLYVCLVYSFHVPLFFFVSGYLEKQRSPRETFFHASKTLLIPYLALNLIAELCHLCFFFHARLFSFTPPEFSTENISRQLCAVLLGSGYETNYSLPIASPLWFVIALFFIKILHAAFLSITNGRTWVFVALTLCCPALFFLFRAAGLFHLGCPFDSALLAFPFFAVGWLLRKDGAFVARNLLWASRILKLARDKIAVFAGRPAFYAAALFVSLLAFSLLIFAFRFNVDWADSSHFIQPDINFPFHGKSIFAFYAIGFWGVVATRLLCVCYTRELRLVTTLSAGTILILALHYSVSNPLLLDVFSDWLSPGVAPFTLIALSVLGVLLYYPIIKLAECYFPAILGGRKKLSLKKT